MGLKHRQTTPVQLDDVRLLVEAGGHEGEGRRVARTRDGHCREMTREEKVPPNLGEMTVKKRKRTKEQSRLMVMPGYRT